MIKIKNILLSFLFVLLMGAELFAQSITVTYPNGGETLQIGKSVNVLWTSSSVTYVNVQYSTDNGVTWNTIANYVPASIGKYTWDIDSNSVNPSTEALIKIVSTANSSVNDVSNSNFTLSELRINYPNSNSILQKGRASNITWFASSDITGLDFEYSVDGGNSWVTFASGVDPNDVSYLWDVNIPTSNRARLRVTASNDPKISFETDDFIVSELSLISPVGGESWQAGTTHAILWQSENVVNVDLQYSVDGGTWQNIATNISAGGGSYSWTIPDELSDQVYVKIKNSDASNVYDVSSSQFTILNLKITSPNGSEGFEIGTTQAVTWSSNLTGTVTIELSTDGGANYDTEIASGVDINLGSYSFTVGNTPTNQAKIRIISDSDNSILDESEDNFTIGSLTITSPAGGENWLAGTYHQLSWQSTDGIDVVSIDYSSDNGATWNVAVANYPASYGIYYWYIPNGLSGDIILRMYDAVTEIGKSHVSNPISVATLQITSPLNGAIYKWGDVVTVNWTASSNISNVRIEYSTDYGSTYTLIENNVNAAAGTYNWTIPNGLSSDGMKIRLTAEDNSAFSSTSPGYFTVGNIQLLTPNGGEKIVGGIYYNITWSATNSIGNVRLEYSTDGGVTYTNIPGASSVPASDGSYAWYVPNVSTTQARIRISDSQTANIIDESDNDFTIGILHLTNPNGGKGYFPNDNVTITWTSQYVDALLIEYTTDGGSNWTTIASNVDPTLGSYNWTIPNIYTNYAQVRISDLNNSNNYDVSDQYFKIGNIKITSPNGNEIFQVGKTYNVTYDYSNNISSINLEISTDNGTSWNYIASNVTATGTYSWTVNDIPTTTAIMKITDSDYPELTDQSDNTFTIKRLNLLAPNGGEFFLVDSIATISWNSAEISNIKIDYSTDNGAVWNTVVSSTPAAPQSYDWRVPNTYSINTLIRLSDADNPSAFIEDTSDAVFTINLLYLESPNGGEAYNVYNTTLIKWHSHNSVSTIDLQYSTNNGTSWNPIASGITASDNQYAWQVPNTPTNEALVRIVNQANANILDVSNATFSIGSIQITSPNGGERWQVDSVKYIKWNNLVSVSEVNLLYSTDGGTTWTTIANNVDATAEQYAWTVPNTVSANAYVRVESSADTTIHDESNSAFSIANIIITSPNGGEYLQAGKNYNITWDSYNISTVTIQYSTDNGTTWNTIISNYAAALGSYSFTIPDNISSNTFLIKIYDDDFNTVHDISDASANVELLSLTSPVGGEAWNSGATKNITWNYANVSNIDILFSDNGGNTWNTLAQNVSASSGSYSWTIPDTSSTNNAIIKILDSQHTGISDSSSNYFTLGKINVTQPVSGDSWQAGTVQTVKWNATTSISAVSIDFSSDGGTNWTNLESNFSASVGSYSFLVPDVSTSNAIIKVSDATSGSEIYDVSDVFTVSSLNITSPTSSSLWMSGNSYDITWTSSNIANVKLEYSTDDGSTWNNIVASVSAVAGKYTWNIPSSLASSKMRIKITDISNPLSVDSTDAFVVGNINITNPTASSVLQGGKSYKINWVASEGIENVNIEYSTNNGTTWHTIKSNVSASDSSVNWIVPNNISSANSLIRISHTSSDFTTGNAIYSTSPTFDIVYLNLQTPTSATNWQANSTENITWQASSILSTISLYYSIDNGTNWQNITSGINASSGSYSWMLPDTVSSEANVKIVSDEYSGISDSLSSTFKISDIVIDNIDANTEWQVSGTANIKWTAYNLSSIDIEYSTDNGANWNNIISGLSASLGEYQWTVPSGTATNQALVRISSTNYPSVATVTPLFTIKELLVSSPNGGENWQIGKSETITWTSQYVNNVAIDLSTDNGTNWQRIVNNVSASSSNYTWVVPDTISTVQGLIRIIDANNDAIRDSSDANFTIGRLLLTSPVGGEEWQEGSTHNISWYSVNVNNVILEYSTDNGATWNTIINSVNASEGAYAWQVPSGSASTTALIRITSLDDATVSYTSHLFTITQLNVVSPNGGEIWQAGSAYPIQWTSANIDKIDLKYSTDNGSSWNTIVSGLNASSGSLNWTVPNNINSSYALVKIINSDDSTQNDVSDDVFTINSFQITYPIGTEHLQAGRTYDITWASGDNISTITLEYSLDGGTTWQTIISNYDASAHHYSWQIPSAVSSSTAQVRISDDGSSLKSTSGNFSIHILDLLTPAGNEYWENGDTENITWNASLTNNIKIEFSTDNGNTWNTISNSENASGSSYSWLIPFGYSTNEGIIKISDTDYPDIYSQNINPVTIGNIKVLSPNGGEILQSGENYQIKWTQSSSVHRVNIEYSTDNGISWNTIANASDSNGSYTWTIPENIYSDNSLIRITDAESSGAISDVSDAVFKIGSLKLLSPNGGESLLSGTNYDITWLAGTNISNIKIEFYTPSNGWSVIENSVPANTGSYSWLVPAIYSDSIKIRITSTTDNSIFDVSDSLFRIAYVKITSPVTADKWQYGDTEKITWNKSSNVQNINLYYSIGNGIWNSIASNVNAGSGEYSWSIPNVVSDKVHLKIEDANGVNTITDSTSFNITIVNLALNVPNAQTVWLAGSTQDILWSASNFIDKVSLKYSIDNAQTWIPIADSLTATNGKYSWKIPSSINSDSILLTIYDVSDFYVDDTSSYFKISSADLTLLAPNGGEYWQAGTDVQIKWNASSNISLINIYYSTDSGTNWNSLISNYPASSQSYDYSIPANFSTDNFRIKIEDANNNFLRDSSSQDTYIRWIKLNSPLGGEHLQAGLSFPVQWTNSSNLTSVRIDFSTDGGNTWNNLATTSSATGQYDWLVNNIPSDSALIRISDANSNLAISEQSNPFTISMLKLTSPVNGGTLQGGDTVKISWLNSNDIENLLFYYSYDKTNWYSINSVPYPADSNSYNWVLNNSVCGDSVYIKIADFAFPTVSDTSELPLDIKQLYVLNPAENQQFQVGSTAEIKWTACGITDITIQYSISKGINWIDIATGVSASAGTYNWTVPNTVYDSALVRIVDENNSTISATSGYFKIYQPDIEVVYPNGNEFLQSGKSVTIRWNSSLVNYINFEYSIDNGTTWNTIANTVNANLDTLVWTIPNGIHSTQCLIRATDTEDATIFDVSNNQFTIADLVLTSPLGDEYLEAGDKFEITWTASSEIQNVKLSFTTNGGVVWNGIDGASNLNASAGSFNWTIPNSLSADSTQIRVQSVAHDSVLDISGNFTTGWVAVTEPSGGETFVAGQNVQVKWNYASSVKQVLVELLNGSGNNVIVSEIDSAKEQSTYLNIPDYIVSDSLRIRLSDIRSSYKIADTTDYFYSTTLKIVKPDNNTNWQAGSTQQIIWTSGSHLGNLAFEYSLDGGDVWFSLADNVTASADTLEWQVPDNLNTNQALIRCFDKTILSLADTTEPFTIYTSQLSLITPNGGEKLQAGSQYTIKWSSSFVTNLRIEFSSDNGVTWDTLASSVIAADSSWDWNIPNGISTSEGLIKLVSLEDSTLQSQSNSAFSIGWITVLTPVLNDVWMSGQNKVITWQNSSSVNKVNLFYSLDGSLADSTLTLISANVNAADTHYVWTVPPVYSSTARILITDAESNGLIKANSPKFVIAKLQLISPNGGEFIQSGSALNIDWSVSESIIPFVNLDYSLNGGRTWARIATSVTASDTTYAWEIPSGLTSDSAMIKISSTTNADIADSSDGMFSIGGLELIVFNSPEKVLENTQKDIRWSITQNIDKIDLLYKTKDNVWKPIVQNYPGDSTHYLWTIPEDPSDSCYVMIRDSHNPLLSDISNEPFTIARLKLLNFNGGGVYQTGTTQEIYWDASYINYLNIEYSVDSVNWNRLTANPIVGDSGKFTWNIPDEMSIASRHYKLRLVDAEYTNIADTSASEFTISFLKIKSPNGGEGQQLGTSYNVEWSASTNTIDYVNLYLELQAGTDIWTPIANNIPASDLQYYWLIQTDPSPAARMKVEDAQNHSIYDVSDSSFIIANIKLLEPNGGPLQKLQVGDTTTIRWSSTYINNITIEYSVNDGANWNFISVVNGDDGQYTWTVPNSTSDKVRLRIKDFDYPNVFDLSDTTFSIVSLRVTEPNDYVAYDVGSQTDIKWQSSYLDSVRIQLSTDGGSTFGIEIAVVDAAPGSYSWSVPNIPTANAKIRITDIYSINVSDVSDTTFLIGAYPTVTSLGASQSGNVQMLYNIPNAGEVVEIRDFEYSVNGGSYVDGKSYLIGDYSHLVGPAMDTLVWNSKGQLDNFEGYVNFRIKFHSLYGVSYSVSVDSIFVDNKAPVFNSTRFTITQDNFLYGWNKAIAKWDSASDHSQPVRYQLFVSENSVFDTIPNVDSYGTQAVLNNLKTSTTYYYKIRVSDTFDNYSEFTAHNKTNTLADFNSDGRIDGADLAAYVYSWSSPDSSSGADMFPYNGDLPIVEVQPDNVLDLSDLITFQQMWNYYVEYRGLPKESSDLDSESKEITFVKGDNHFEFPIELPQDKYSALSIAVKFNTESFDFDSLDFVRPSANPSDIVLTYLDSAKGEIVIDYANLSGEIANNFSLKSVINCKFNALKHADSLSVTYKAYNNKFTEAFNKTVVYSLHELPNTFKIYQNFPNPFNPVTTILYDVPKKAKVSIKVYDILGREVATLVNEVKKPGSYKVNFSANLGGKTLASGVYFYRIVAGNYVATKKMILLK